MRGNSHVRFGAGDEETCLGDGARRFIPTLPGSAAGLSLSYLTAGTIPMRLTGNGARQAGPGVG